MSVLDEIEAAIPRLRRAAHALTRDASLADDLVQDSLERALARRHHWRGEGPVSAWLWRIMLNLHRDALRRPSSHLVVVGEIETLAAPETGAEAHLALAEVRAAMSRLPEDQRQALVLVALEGRSLKEAADLLDIAEGTFVSRLGRARASLRAMTGRERDGAGRKGTAG